MDKIEKLEQYLIKNNVKHIQGRSRSYIDRFKIPATHFKTTEKNIKFFNKIASYFDKDWTRLSPTRCGAISKDRKKFRLPGYFVSETKSGVQLVILTGDYQFRIIMGYHETGDDESKYFGFDALRDFTKVCQEFGVDFEKFRLSPSEGEAIKNTIRKNRIELVNPNYAGKIFEGCFHIDINSAFPAGMAKAFPELYQPINKLYTERKEKPINKKTLNFAWGIMQSKYNAYGMAQLSKAGTDFCHERLDFISDFIDKIGGKRIGYNTDGLWFQIYSNNQLKKIQKLCSSELGGFKLDHQNCKLRFKSAGCYEFIENGQYYPVVRGQTRMDKCFTEDGKLDRSQWVWGCIFKPEFTAIRWKLDTNTLQFTEILEDEIYG